MPFGLGWTEDMVPTVTQFHAVSLSACVMRYGVAGKLSRGCVGWGSQIQIGPTEQDCQ